MQGGSHPTTYPPLQELLREYHDWGGITSMNAKLLPDLQTNYISVKQPSTRRGNSSVPEARCEPVTADHRSIYDVWATDVVMRCLPPGKQSTLLDNVHTSVSNQSTCLSARPFIHPSVLTHHQHSSSPSSTHSSHPLAHPRVAKAERQSESDANLYKSS